MVFVAIEETAWRDKALTPRGTNHIATGGATSFGSVAVKLRKFVKDGKIPHTFQHRIMINNYHKEDDDCLLLRRTQASFAPNQRSGQSDATSSAPFDLSKSLISQGKDRGHSPYSRSDGTQSAARKAARRYILETGHLRCIRGYTVVEDFQAGAHAQECRRKHESRLEIDQGSRGA